MDRDLGLASGFSLGVVMDVTRLERIERVLHLRCILINGMWGAFAEHLVAARDLRLAAKPAPARTHDAKPVKEAA